jgi:hypothetical protein
LQLQNPPSSQAFTANDHEMDKLFAKKTTCSILDSQAAIDFTLNQRAQGWQTAIKSLVAV